MPLRWLLLLTVAAKCWSLILKSRRLLCYRSICCCFRCFSWCWRYSLVAAGQHTAACCCGSGAASFGTFCCNVYRLCCKCCCKLSAQSVGVQAWQAAGSLGRINKRLAVGNDFWSTCWPFFLSQHAFAGWGCVHEGAKQQCGNVANCNTRGHTAALLLAVYGRALWRRPDSSEWRLEGGRWRRASAAPEVMRYCYIPSEKLGNCIWRKHLPLLLFALLLLAATPYVCVCVCVLRICFPAGRLACTCVSY